MANLKYINQTYLRDNFLMIRDGDGKDAEELASSLCRYYEARNREDNGQTAACDSRKCSDPEVLFL